MTPQRFAAHVRADLQTRRWLRLHCALIGGLTLLTAWACSHTLMRLGTEALWLRYGVAFVVAYALLLLLLYLWARWLLSRDEVDDVPQIDGGGGGSRSAGESPAFKSGEGGDFGGAGGGGSFEAPGADAVPDALAEGAGNAAGSVLEAAGAADEGVLILVPLALVIGIALAIGTALGFVVFGLFGVEVLLAVAVELAIASVGGALAYKAGVEGWLGAAWRRTRGAALVGLAALVVLGAAIDHWLPEARSLPHAVQLLRAV
jgi:hypothetical protein